MKKIFILISGVFISLTAASYTQAASVNLAWDASTSGGTVTGYKVYWSTTSGTYTNTNSISVVGASKATVTGLDDTKKYYFIARAYNSAGLSAASNEVSWYDQVPPASPVVAGATPTNDTTPTWTWTAGGGGSGTYRYKLDSSAMTTGAIQTTSKTFTPATAVAVGTHTLYVQERDAAGNWSASGSKSILIDTTAPDATTSLSNLNYLIASSGITISGSNTGDVSKIRLYVNSSLYMEIKPSGTSWSYSYTGALAAGYTFELRVVDAAGNESVAGAVKYRYTSANPFKILTKTLQSGVVGKLYSVTIYSDTAGIAWNLAGGSLPAGLALSSGMISGTPTAAGLYTVSISGTNSLKETLIRQFTLTIDPAGTNEYSIEDSVNGTEVIVSSSSGAIINLQSRSSSDLKSLGSYSFLYGVLSFQVTGLAAGGSATLTFDFEEPVTAGTVWLWFNPATGAWTDISGSAGITTSGFQITVKVTDGSPGDSDSTSGQITDLSGPAVSL